MNLKFLKAIVLTTFYFVINFSFGQEISKTIISAFHSDISNKHIQLAAGSTLTGISSSPTIQHGFYPLNVNPKKKIEINFDYFITYPNPFNNQITVSFNKTIALISEVNIHSITGALVYTQLSTLETIYIDTQDFAQGLYFISVSNGEKEFVTQKILKL